MRRVLLFTSITAIVLATPRPGAASGLEILPGGARSVARGGAVAARPEDPMSLDQNPAAMATLGGNQVIFGFDLPLNHLCVQPYGYYGWGVYNGAPSEFGNPLALDNPNSPTPGATYASTPLGKVCNSAPAIPVPQIAWVGRITDEFALGAGLLAPVVVGNVQYGGADGTVQTPFGPRPTPTRYSLVKQEGQFALAPSVGGAYRVLHWLSAGVTAQVLMLKAQTVSVQNFVSGTQPSTDGLATATAQDFFVPALTVSVHAQPDPSLSLMTSFRWVDDFRGSGNVVYETNTFQRGATSGPVPFENAAIALSNVTVRFPWQLTAGARYAGLLPRGDGFRDPINSELWDVELDLSYSFDKRAGISTVEAGQDVNVLTRTAEGKTGGTPIKREDISALSTDAHLKNSYAVRVGGSYAILPRQLIVHAGGFFESRGVEPEYADIDTFALQRMGLGVGLVVRVGAFDLQAGYGHIFSETLDVAPPPHQNVENASPGNPQSGFDKRIGGTFGSDGTRNGGVVVEDPRAPAPSQGAAVASKTQQSPVSTNARPNRIINAGEYTATFNLVSVGAVYHF